MATPVSLISWQKGDPVPSTWFTRVRLNQLINSVCLWSVTDSNPIRAPSPIAFKEQVFWLFGTTFFWKMAGSLLRG